MDKNKSALMLGATGGIGGAIASALIRHGWRVHGMARDITAASVRARSDLDWHQGDAMNRADVVAAAEGVSAIVHAVNPPGYRHWDKLVLPMIDNTIAAARLAGDGARVVLPGTIYNFDPKHTPVLNADSPQSPKTRKGRIRAELEQRLEQASAEVPALILRAGDFFGPGARASWFSQAMIAPGRPVRRIVNPAIGAGHSWAYLPDLAETFALLMDNEERLSNFERVQFEGFFDASGRGMSQALSSVTRRDLHESRFPWRLMKVMAPFGGFPREAAEIAPYWRYPLRLDNQRLQALIGPEPRTAIERALETTLQDMGCLDMRPAIAGT